MGWLSKSESRQEARHSVGQQWEGGEVVKICFKGEWEAS